MLTATIFVMALKNIYKRLVQKEMNINSATIILVGLLENMYNRLVQKEMNVNSNYYFCRGYSRICNMYNRLVQKNQNFNKTIPVLNLRLCIIVW